MAKSPYAYHYLGDLLGGYFHQDCYDDGETDETIVQEFRKTSHAYQQIGVTADVQRFLKEHPHDTHHAFEKTFQPDVTIGHTDTEVQAWLTQLVHFLQRTA